MYPKDDSLGASMSEIANCRCSVEYFYDEKNESVPLTFDGTNSTIAQKTLDGEGIEVHVIGQIDIDIYSCITEDIVTREVIITDNQIQHIKERHPNDYERFSVYFGQIVSNPDYLIKTNKPNTALILKEVHEADESFKTVLRLATSSDDPTYKNSIITFMKIDDKEWNRLLRNKEILYKRE